MACNEDEETSVL